MERNVWLYPIYQAARSSTFWLPVFFLYFSSRFDVADVLVLEAIYYGAVVVLEVPSGYLSDRLGRRPTMVAAAVAWSVGYAALALGGSWWVFAAGQVAVAMGMAFNSGTDSTMVYESLAAQERGGELAAVEGKAQAWGAIAMAVAALVGGVLASVDLRFGHALSAVGTVVALGVALLFEEPRRAEAAARPMAQLRGVGVALRTPALRWVFLFAVAMTVFAHVPYELAQPYLRLVLRDLDFDAFTPAVSGLMMALMMGAAALASRRGEPLARRIGTANVLLVAMGLEGLVIVGMSLTLHPAVIGLLLVRSVPGALSRPLELQCVLPNVGGHLRATYLSVQSLAGRLAFAGTLALGSWAVGGLDDLDGAAISTLTGGVAVAVLLALLALALTRRAVRDVGV
ncbi:MAG: MFS transporter [Nannocystaceae bacterium]|nr:MFS transporter [bacterium]